MFRNIYIVSIILISLLCSCTFEPSLIQITDIDKKDKGIKENGYFLEPCNSPEDCSKSASAATFCCMDPEKLTAGIVPNVRLTEKGLGYCRRSCVQNGNLTQTERLCTKKTETQICNGSETCYGKNSKKVGHCGIEETKCEHDKQCNHRNPQQVCTIVIDPNDTKRYKEFTAANNSTVDLKSTFPDNEIVFQGICTTHYKNGDICNFIETSLPIPAGKDIKTLFDKRSTAYPICQVDSYTTFFVKQPPSTIARYGRIAYLCVNDDQCKETSEALGGEDFKCISKGLVLENAANLGICQRVNKSSCTRNNECDPILRCCETAKKRACLNAIPFGGSCSNYADDAKKKTPWFGYCKDDTDCKKINAASVCRHADNICVTK